MITTHEWELKDIMIGGFVTSNEHPENTQSEYDIRANTYRIGYREAEDVWSFINIVNGRISEFKASSHYKTGKDALADYLNKCKGGYRPITSERAGELIAMPISPEMDFHRFIEIIQASPIDDIREFSGCDVYNGLTVIRKYLPKAGIEAAEHDKVYSTDIKSLIEAGIIDADVVRLRQYGWMVEDDECLSCFV